MESLRKGRPDAGPLHEFAIFPLCLTFVALTAISPALAVLTDGSAERWRAATRWFGDSAVIVRVAQVGDETSSFEDRVWVDGGFCEE